MSSIPVAIINSPELPNISNVEFLRQVVDNISNQINSLDLELANSKSTNIPEVIKFAYLIFIFIFIR